MSKVIIAAALLGALMPIQAFAVDDISGTYKSSSGSARSSIPERPFRCPIH